MAAVGVQDAMVAVDEQDAMNAAIGPIFYSKGFHTNGPSEVLQKLNPHFHHVVGAFSQIGPRGIVQNGFLLPNAIKACAALHALKPGRQVHGFASVSGLDSDSIVMSSLMRNEGVEPYLVSWNGMIAGKMTPIATALSQEKMAPTAYKTSTEMRA
ncbi:putative pentatricopeptide repeat-containing protein [Sesbania bispinosa]|nr:putative pentatricopeptide repeat-containing protein [Sesbania bispinosa]